MPGDVAAAIDLLETGRGDVYGTVTDNALAIAARVRGAAIVPGAFTTVTFAAAVPKGRSAAARERLTDLIGDARAVGIIQRTIDRLGLKGVRLAPE